jgi:hypothetical protein
MLTNRMKAFSNIDICVNCLNVTLFDEKMKFYFTVDKNLLTLTLDFDPDPELDPDPHSSKRLDPDITNADP